MFWQAFTWGLGIGLGAACSGLAFGLVLRIYSKGQDASLDALQERNEIGRSQVAVLREIHDSLVWIGDQLGRNQDRRESNRGYE